MQVVRLKGGLRLGDAVQDFRNTVEGLIEEGDTSIVLNLAEVPMMDSSGIGELIRLYTKLKRDGGELKLVSPGKFVLHTMNLVRVATLFDIHQDEAEAVNSFGLEVS